MNRFEIELKLRSGIINGRKWRCDRYGGANRLSISEVSPTGKTCERYFPGIWKGQPNIGFRTLELAGCDRRRAMACPAFKDWHVRSFKRMARSKIEHSRYLRLMAEPVAVEVRRAA